MTAGSARLVRAPEPRPQRLRELTGQVGWGIFTWVVGIAFFLPVLWMVITAFKPESAAETWPPRSPSARPWPSSGWGSPAGARS